MLQLCNFCNNKQMISKNIFRAYDIRGTYPDQLGNATANLIGKGFAAYLVNKLGNKKPSVAVSRDCRTHGEELKKAFVSGLISSGCHVKDIGVAASPYLYFANTFGGFDAGCSITASHNPKNYNGFKLITKNAHAVFGDEIQKIYEIIESGQFTEGKGKSENCDFSEDYFKKLQDIFTYQKPITIVVDTGNGVAGAAYPAILKKFGHKVIELFTELDGEFPNHQPDPIVEDNLSALKVKVAETGAHLGIAFDGDGDRIGIVDEKSAFMDSDKILMLLSKDVLTRHPKKSIVFTVSNSQTLFDLVKEWGGNPIMCKVGHSYVEDAMSKNNAILGGEQSGHFFLPEKYFPYDDALVAALRIIKIIGESDKSASKLFSEFPKTYSIPEIRPKCPDEIKFEIIKKIIDHFKDKYPSSTLDGIRIDFGNGGWSGIRASNTSPRISITMEALSHLELDKIKEVVLGHLKTYNEIEWNN